MDRPASLVTDIVQGPSQDPRALLARAAKRKGGLERLAAVRSVESMARAQGATMHIRIQYPDHYRVDYLVDGRLTRTLTWDGSEFRMTRDGAPLPLGPEETDKVRASVRASTIRLLVAASSSDTRLVYLGELEVQGRKAHALDATFDDGFRVTLFVDRETDDPIGTRYQAGGGQVTVIESDFRDVEGLRIAHQTRVLMRGTEVLSELDRVTINPDLPAEIFQVGAN